MSSSPMTYSSSSKKTSYGLPPSSGDVPLSAERAMMDEIRSKLERTQRRLARNAPSSATSVTSVSSKSPFLSSSSPMIEPSSRNSSSRPRSTVPFADAQSGASSSKSQLPRRQHALPLSSSNRRPLSSVHSTNASSSATALASTMRYAQYKSRSKYANSSATFDTDPLNGGPPVMSTPYLVYSSSRVPMSNRSSRPSLATQPRGQQETSHHAPSTVSSALRSGIAARPPSSRVRFQSHETRDRADDTAADGAMDDNDDDDDSEQKRRQALVKEREARHVRHRELELQKSRETGPLSPIATATRGRRSDNPPSSAIKPSAYDEMLQSTVGRLRRSSIGHSPPKSDIQVAAYEEVRPRRWSSQEALEKRRKELEAEEEEEEEERRRRRREEGEGGTTRDEKGGVKLLSGKVPLVLRPRGGRRDGDGVTNVSEGEGGDTSAYETDDSYDFSDFDTDSTDGQVSRHVVGELEPTATIDVDEKKRGATKCHQDQVDEGEEELQPVSRLTAKDLALYALGRASTSALSDLESPVASLNGNGNGSLKKKQTAALKSCTPAPTSYTPTSSAFPSARALEKRPVFATTGRTRDNRAARPSTSTSVSSYVRRSRPRAPMDLKNHLPPSIGVLSGLSSGSSTFSIDPSCFYEVTWKSGEFAFSVQQVYTDENEYEFDDRGDEPQLFLRMLLNTERSVCKSFRDVRVGDVLIRVGDTNVSDLGLEGSGTVLTKFFAKLMTQTPIRLTFQRMSSSDWEGGVEL
uniref:PDZ domain-containing protein n=1 Tax=Peronospora matthiolae TaxID=2874970 RepID=A0AAV1TD39_9STRA